MNTIARQCRLKAEKEGALSLLNNTKWREICLAFSMFEDKPAWRTRDFLNGYLSDWDSLWFHHVGPDYCTIEWMEIDPRKNGEENIMAILRLVGVTFEKAERYFRVIGYRK